MALPRTRLPPSGPTTRPTLRTRSTTADWLEPETKPGRPSSSLRQRLPTEKCTYRVRRSSMSTACYLNETKLWGGRNIIGAIATTTTEIVLRRLDSRAAFLFCFELSRSSGERERREKQPNV